MKKWKCIMPIIVFIMSGILFSACESGDSSKSSLPLDDRLVGQWEGYVDGNPAIITITGSNQIKMINIISDDYTGEDGEAGEIMGGLKGTVSSETDSTYPQKGTMNWDISEMWVEEGDYDPITSEPVPCNNWYAMDEPETDYDYELFNDNNTLIIYDTPAGNLTFQRGTAPKPDSRLTGTWRLEEDTDRMDIILSASGSFSMSHYNISNPDSPDLIESESGTYGVYRSVEGRKYFVVSITDSNGTPVYKWQRMKSYLLMFLDPDPDKLVVVSPGDEMVFMRQGTDPTEPAPDEATVGMWQYSGAEFVDDDEDEGTPDVEIDCDVIITFKPDNTYERIILYPASHEKYGEMARGERGHYLAGSGEMIIWSNQEWDGDLWVASNGYIDFAYSADGDVCTITGEDDGEIFEMQLSSIPEPAMAAELQGTWHCENGSELIEITIDQYGKFIILEYNNTDPYNPILIRSERGTCGVSIINGVQYFTLVREYRDDSDPIAEIPTDDNYNMIRMTYQFLSGSPDSFTLGGEMTFIKQ